MNLLRIYSPARGASATCQQPGSPSFPQQVLRVRTFRQLFRSASRSFVANGASYSRQFVTDDRNDGRGPPPFMPRRS